MLVSPDFIAGAEIGRADHLHARSITALTSLCVAPAILVLMPKTTEDLISITGRAQKAGVQLDSTCAAYDTDEEAVIGFSEFAAVALAMADSEAILDPAALIATGFTAGLLVAHSVPNPAPLTPPDPSS